METDLFLCPFCESESISDSSNAAESCFIFCMQCGAEGPQSSTYEEAVKGWNHRAKAEDTASINKVADWAMAHGMATGHAETLDSLLAEMTATFPSAKASLSAEQVAVLNRVIKHMADGAAWCPDGSPLQGELLADAATLRALITPTNPADTERKE